ncbi:MAG: hypothetical protein K2N23_01410, partial [Clostridia bacterium]|nr:hypothetical protein [Clostridia bacterium]
PDVKTISEGKEPNRYIAVIPNNAKPYDKGLRYGDRKPDRREGKSFDDRRRGGDRRGRGGRSGGSSSGAKRGKKEIYFGTFLGNSGAKPEPEKEEE